MKIEAPRGTADVLPSGQPIRERIVATAERYAERYGYRRITTPTFEDTALFTRTSGEGSDVVQKEMYTFKDRAGRSLTLRPEGTAPVARAYVEHGLHREPQPVKTFYVCPMFRYAAPQKGRYREFWQIGVEVMGTDDPALDAEVIQLFVEIARSLEVRGLRLELNSIGDRRCRPAYFQLLREFLSLHDEELDEETRQKAVVSPLRVFDAKNPSVQRTLAEAPKIGESLCPECKEHFEEVRAFLDAYGVAYELRPTLVRGLDYYTRTVFEFVNDALGGAQSAVCAGGRYDYLTEEIGGPPTPGIGWAAGVERLAMSSPVEATPPKVDVFFGYGEGVSRPELFAQMALLRLEGWRCDAEYAGRSIKGQRTQARRLGARYFVYALPMGAVISAARGGPERDVPISAIAETLRRLEGKAGPGGQGVGRWEPGGVAPDRAGEGWREKP